jgi:hypothetical protein
LIAIIGLIGTLIAGLLSSPLLPILLGGGKPASDAPSITIVGPDQAPLRDKTYYTLISKNAVRAEWSIGGFSNGENTSIEPLPGSYQIFVEPSNDQREGDRFTLVVTVYHENGESATATKEFVIVKK